MVQLQWEQLYLKKQSRRQRRAGGVEMCSRGRASSIPVMAGDHKNMEILIRHSNKPRMNGTPPIPEELFCWDFFGKYYKMTGNSAKLANETRVL